MKTNPAADLFATITGYQRTALLKTAVELDVFGAVAAEPATVADISAHTCAAERGIRILCDSLTALGFLRKSEDRYTIAAEYAALLDPSQPTCMGGATAFIASDLTLRAFASLTEAVRRGGTALSTEGTLEPEHPVWVTFAHAMDSTAWLTAVMIGDLLAVDSAPGWKVLDIAAGHGRYGITLAQRNPRVRVVAQDWGNVLAVAEQNARAAGVANRFEVLAGDAFEVDLGTGYDIVLLPNFLHHFDPPTCERMLARVRGALAPDGRAVIVEFVPDESRTAPPDAATFALVMLATTPCGDAYTYAELDRMCRNAGFSGCALHRLSLSPQAVVIASAG